MFCKHCGNALDPAAKFCPACGTRCQAEAPGTCPSCGAELTPGAKFCTSCGFAVAPDEPKAAPETPAFDPSEQKSRLAAALLAILLGSLGIHNFYLGYVGKGIAQILLTPCCGIGAIWAFIEGIMILTGGITTDSRGIPLKKDC